MRYGEVKIRRMLDFVVFFPLLIFSIALLFFVEPSVAAAHTAAAERKITKIKLKKKQKKNSFKSHTYDIVCVPFFSLIFRSTSSKTSNRSKRFIIFGGVLYLLQFICTILSSRQMRNLCVCCAVAKREKK